MSAILIKTAEVIIMADEKPKKEGRKCGTKAPAKPAAKPEKKK